MTTEEKINIPKPQVSFGMKWRDLNKKSNVINFKNHKFLNEKLKSALRALEVPANFDWSERIGINNVPLITAVRDQGSCGSCYAFAIVGMLQDRISVQTEAKLKLELSTQDMINCGNAFVKQYLDPKTNQVADLIKQGILLDSESFVLQGCNGGLLAAAVNYLVLQGVPIESEEPYIARQQNCSGLSTLRYRGIRGEDLIPAIENGFPSQQIIIPQNQLEENEKNIQMAIYTGGPVVAGLNIYTKFLYYPQTGDIYENTPTFNLNGYTFQNNFEGSHAVEIVGWGENTSGTKYWICKNSWGTNWGNGGYFKIKRGTNESNIEVDVVSVIIDPNQLTLEGNIVTSEPPSSGLSGGMIALIVILSVLVVIAIALGVYFGIKAKEPVLNQSVY